MYRLRPTAPFTRQYKKLIKHNKSLSNKIEKTFLILKENPSHSSLKSHKVNTRHYGLKWSSRVSDDIRLIWDYDSEEVLIILLLDIGSHTGSHKVYK